MEELKQRIIDEGRIYGSEVLKVDSFLNHQMDVELFNKMGKEFYNYFYKYNINKILTIEASGIGIACITAQYFKCPVVFAKKTNSINLDKDTYESEVFSFTKNTLYKVRVLKRYLKKDDRILILDDFLANGKAVLGLENIINEAGAKLCGVGIVIEKGFQEGGKILREKGMDIYSLAIIKSLSDGQITFK